MLRRNAARIDDVIGLLRDAFAGAPRPPDNDLLRSPVTLRSPEDPVHDSERRGAGALRTELAGKTWQDLDRSYLERQWAAFCYLSPQGRRHFLPALLITSLDAQATDSYRHSVTFSLQPDWWSMYWEAGAADTDNLLAVCTVAEQRAVAAWLGLVHDLDDACHWLAAQSLHWVWNRIDTEDLRRVRAHYGRMHGWSRPRATGEIERLIVAIEEAFAGVAAPAADRIVDSRMGDEPAEYGMEFRGTDWRRLHPEFLSYHYASLSFFTDRAFHYYLPAHLIADLLGSAGNAEPTFHLAEGRREAVEWSPAQCEAIVRYLRWCVKAEDIEMPELQQALGVYWLPRCRSDPDS